MKNLILIAWISIITFSSYSIAQQQGFWKTFTTTDGLASNNVFAIIESSNGTLWFGTGGGASRFHEGIWTSYTTANELAGNDVRAIFESSDGALWFGTWEGGGLSRYHNEKWTTFNTTNSGLADNGVLAIIESSDGALWFGTGGGGVSRYQNGNWDTITTADGLAHNDVRAIIESSDGALWFGTRGGVNRYHEGRICTTLTTADGLADNFVFVIIESRDGALWFGTRGGVSRYHEGRICTTFTAIDGLVYGGVSAIIESSDGAMWFGTGGGMGTGGGVSRYQDGKWDTVTTADELPNNDVQAIIESSDGALWFGTGGGAGRYQEGRIWTTFIENDDLADSCVMAIVESDGALWFGTYGGGVSRFQNGNWDTFTTADGLVNNCVRAIIESSDGALWFGTAGGVNRFQGGIFTPFTEADGLVDKYVYAIIESSDRALWFGTSGGVSRYQHEIWTSFTKADGLVDNNIRAIIESSNGALWFGTEHGISKLKPDKIPPFTSITNAPDLIAGTNVSDLITGTLTPMFIFHGFDYRTPEHKLLYSYAVFDGGGNPVLDWSDYSNVTYIKTPALRDGKLRFSVIAIDSWGNEDPTPATKLFTIDSTPPTVIISSPEDQDFVSGPVEIRGSAFDPFPSQDFHSYELRYANWNDFEDISKWKTDRFSGIDSSRQIRDSTLAIWETKGLTNGRYWLQLSARDTLGHESRTFVAVEVVNASEITDAINGSFLSSESGNIEIYIPPNAIPNDLTIGIKDYPIDEVIPVPDSGITFANLCFEIVPTDIILSKPGTLSLIYPDSLITNKKEYTVAFYYAHSDTNDNGYSSWERLGGTINTKEKKITTSFEQFGLFALFEDSTHGIEKEGIFDVNCQPRIFSPKGDERTAISFELGKRTNVTIKIYNAAGRLVKILKYNESFSHGNNVVFWDGKDRWSKFCVSGLYIVTIEAGDKMATKTFMVLNE